MWSLAAILFVVTLWLGGTAILLRLSRLRGPRAHLALATLTAAAGAAFWGAWALRDSATVEAVFAGFACGVVIWAWHELSFLQGHLVGPRRGPCAPGASSARRFLQGTAALLHHELAIAATGLALLAVSWGGENTAAAAAFCALWALRISVKLNIFMGAPKLAHELLPAQLAHLKSYFGRAEATPLFALSIALGAGAFAAFTYAAVTADAPALAVAAVLPATLIALGLLEHGFLLCPAPEVALTRWALPADDHGRRPAEPSSAVCPRRAIGPWPQTALNAPTTPNGG